MLYISCTAMLDIQARGLPPECEDPSEDHGLHAVRVSLGVGECQGGAPAASENHPAGDSQVLPELLQVRDKVPRRVILDERKKGGK